MEAVTAPIIKSIIRRLEEESSPLSLVSALSALLKARAKVVQASEPLALSLGFRKTEFRKGIPHARVLLKLQQLHVSRGAQVWISVHSAMTIDAAIDRPLADELAERHCLLYALLDVQDRLLPWLKETSAYIASLAFGQHETNIDSLRLALAPECPRLGRLGWGWVGKYCDWLSAPRRKPSCAFRDKILRAAENILYLKRSCPCMLPHVVSSELKKQRERLTREVVEDSSPAALIRTRVASVANSLVRCLFAGVRFDPTETTPSGNACFENKRLQGGAFEWTSGSLHQNISTNTLLLRSDLDRIVEVGPGRLKELRRDVAAQLLVEDYTKTVNKRVSSRRYVFDLEVNSALPFSKWISESRDLWSLWDDVSISILESGISLDADLESIQRAQRIHTMPFPVLEPAKCRIITMGEAAPYQRLFQIQKLLWNKLSGLPAFEFTHKPIDLSSWRAIFGAPSILFPGQSTSDRLRDSSFLSGDFSAATDNLDPRMSESVWESIARTVLVKQDDGKTTPLKFTRWYELGLAGLTKHRLCYGKRAASGGTYEPTESDTDQSWGQLMGSPVSFPILNIVNAASTVVSMVTHVLSLPEEDVLRLAFSNRLIALGVEDGLATYESNPESPLPAAFVLDILDSFRVRTNGDDLFFLCPDKGYGCWKETVTACGLKPSLGKNYLSKDFAVINSELRSYSRPQPHQMEPQADWTYMSFLNLPLVFGLEAKGPDAGKSVLNKMAFWELRPLLQGLLRGVDDRDVRDRRCRAFVKYHLSVLGQLGSLPVSWVLPEEIGGLGLPLETYAPIGDASLRRAAWLACLDPRKRSKAVAFPRRESSSPMELILERVRRHAVRLWQVKTEQNTNVPTPTRLQTTETSLVPLPLLLRESNYSSEDNFTLTNLYDAAESMGVSVEEMVTRKAVHQAILNLRSQFKKSSLASRHLTPMNVDTAREWSGPRIEAHLVYASYDVPHVRW